MNDREERIARNEAVSREANEAIEDTRRARPGPMTMICECGRTECEAAIRISVRDYEKLRTDPRRFAVARGHEFPDVERIVQEADWFVVVEKVEGTSAAVAEDLDPRA
jgi:hypothetical protein